MLYFNEIHILGHILAFLCDEPLSPFCQNRLISVRTLRNVESTQTKTKVRWNELQFTRPVPNLDEIHSAVPEIKHADRHGFFIMRSFYGLLQRTHKARGCLSSHVTRSAQIPFSLSLIVHGSI